MSTITIDKAEKELAALIERVRQGEEIVISDGTEPRVKLALVDHQPATKPSLRGRGILKGKAKVSDEDLFGPMSEDELKRWWGEDK